MGKIGRKTQVLSPHFLYRAYCEFCGSIRRWCKCSKPLGARVPRPTVKTLLIVVSSPGFRFLPGVLHRSIAL